MHATGRPHDHRHAGRSFYRRARSWNSLICSFSAVKYAVHPVAGRTPSHMNVVVAEANIPYDRLYDIGAINLLLTTLI